MDGNKFDWLIPIVGHVKFKKNMFIIYELVNKATGNVFYVGITSTPLIIRIKNHFHPNRSNPELYNYLVENKENFYVAVLQYARKSKRERYWVEKRAKTYKLFNKQFVIPHSELFNTPSGKDHYFYKGVKTDDGLVPYNGPFKQNQNRASKAPEQHRQ